MSEWCGVGLNLSSFVFCLFVFCFDELISGLRSGDWVTMEVNLDILINWRMCVIHTYCTYQTYIHTPYRTHTHTDHTYTHTDHT